MRASWCCTYLSSGISAACASTWTQVHARACRRQSSLRAYTCSHSVVLTATLGATAGTRGGIPFGELTRWQPCRYILPAPVHVFIGTVNFATFHAGLPSPWSSLLLTLPLTPTLCHSLTAHVLQTMMCVWRGASSGTCSIVGVTSLVCWSSTSALSSQPLTTLSHPAGGEPPSLTEVWQTPKPATFFDMAATHVCGG